MQGVNYIRKTVVVALCLALGINTSAFAGSFSRAWVTVERSGKISKAVKKAWRDSPLFPELIAESTEKRLGSISAQDLEKLIAKYQHSAAISNLRWRKLFRLGRANWHQDFLFLYRQTDNVELNCYKLEARYRLKQETKLMNERLFVFGHMEKVSQKPAIRCFLSSAKKE